MVQERPLLVRKDVGRRLGASLSLRTPSSSCKCRISTNSWTDLFRVICQAWVNPPPQTHLTHGSVLLPGGIHFHDLI